RLPQRPLAFALVLPSSETSIRVRQMLVLFQRPPFDNILNPLWYFLVWFTSASLFQERKSRSQPASRKHHSPIGIPGMDSPTNGPASLACNRWDSNGEGNTTCGSFASNVSKA